MDQHYLIVLSPEAANDLEAIRKFIARDSIDSAAKVIEQIFSAIQSLSVAPHRTLFQTRRGRSQAVRSLPIKPYVIYFRVFEDQENVTILTVRHGARRRPKRFP